MVAVAGPLVGVWLGAHFAAAKALRERVWDQRTLSYSEIFGALDAMNRILTADLDDEMNRRSRDAEYEASQSAKYSTSRDKLFETVGRESWILPEEFTLKIELLEKTLKARHESYFDSLDSATFECRKVAQDLRDVARRDMASRFNPLMSWVRDLARHRTSR